MKVLPFTLLSLAAQSAPLPRHPLNRTSSNFLNTPFDSDNSTYFGDLRAAVSLDYEAASSDSVTVVPYWRIRPASNQNPNTWTTAIVTDFDGNILDSTTEFLSGTCGIVTFDPAGNNDVHIYPTPFIQTGGNAGLHFSLFNTSQDDVLDTPHYDDARCDEQQTIDLAQFVTGMETTDDELHGTKDMEVIASSSEVAAMVAMFEKQSDYSPTLMAFMEDATRSVMAFDTSVPADWALDGIKESLTISGSPGEYVSFQVGLVNPTGDAVTVSDVSFTNSSNVVPAFNCFSMGGKVSGRSVEP